MMLPLIPGPMGGLKDAANGVVKDWLIDLAGKTGESAQLMLEKTGTFWVTGVDTPQLTVAKADNPYAPADTIAFLWQHLHFYVAGLAVFSILLGAIKMVWERSGQPGRELGLSLLQLVIVSTVGLAVIAMLINVSDEFAAWILKDASTNADGKVTTFQVAFGAMFLGDPQVSAANAVALILLNQLLFWLSLLQIVLLIIRGGMLFLLAGVLPFAAAAGNTQIGRQWLQRSIAWILAFVLYKPVAAIVYATGFQLTREGNPLSASDQILKIVTGLTLCVLAVFALPALMRFTVPAVAGAAGGSSTAGIAALGGAIAMGAKAIGNQSGGSSSSSSGGRGSNQSGGGQQGPSGNTGQSTQSTSTQSSPPSSQPASTGPSGSTGSTGSTGPAGTAGSESASSTAAPGSAGSSASSSGSSGSAAAGASGGVPAAAAAGAVAEAIKKAAAAPGKTTSQAAGEDSGASGAAPSGGASGPSGQSGPSGSGSQKPK